MSRILDTRAKFYITGVTMLPGNGGVRVDLQAVSRGDRNANWAVATPSGNMSMTVNNPKAADQYIEFMKLSRETGRNPEVFIDLYPSEDGWPGDGHKYREADIEPGIYGHGACGECGLKKDAEVSGNPAHPNG